MRATYDYHVESAFGQLPMLEITEVQERLSNHQQPLYTQVHYNFSIDKLCSPSNIKPCSISLM